MYKPLLASEFLKIKRRWVWFLVALGPIGVITIQGFNFGLRYDYLTEFYKDDLWGGLLLNIQSFLTPVIILGSTIIASMIANVDHQSTSWKHLISLPIRKRQIVITKFIVSVLLLSVSCILLSIGSTLLGIGLDFGLSIPWIEVIKASFYPFLATLPILAIQLWISVIYHNQGVAITVGILGVVIGMFGKLLPDWLLWKWPSLINEAKDPIINVYLGIIVGFVLFILLTIHFVRKDVEK
jgi:lantibiotic transport system permease protein